MVTILTAVDSDTRAGIAVHASSNHRLEEVNPGARAHAPNPHDREERDDGEPPRGIATRCSVHLATVAKRRVGQRRPGCVSRAGCGCGSGARRTTVR